MSTSTRITALEAADESSWFKSSYSGDNHGISCVSVAALANNVAVRDSKQHNGPAFISPAAAWTAFIHEVRSGRWPA
ncbi:DUF397 domain-containing protein [Streptomyces rectiverticillatus]|uniref:DUF397 domain-containing protein n=1 Tax=Streptomyces rectiverticillatus TaxID=173860 RepID=UPI0015C36A5D|nr:DUF397 domain-containing protein [Streptomyces rectiverticillatus]QLE72500.1 DUF397 domain-containing protein [Streptomyces rectiverticillatus]